MIIQSNHPMPMTIKRREISRTYAIANTTTANSRVDVVIRESCEAMRLNFGNSSSPLNTPPIPKAQNNKPNPVEFKHRSFLTKRGRSDSNTLPHITNSQYQL